MMRLTFIFLAICSTLLTPSLSKAFDSTSLNQLIAEKKVNSVDQLLNYLPYPLLARYTLVFKSRSLQEASYQNPRVILYGANAKLIATFNGDPNQVGFHTLEVIDFDEQRKRFIFREYSFHGASEKGPTVSVSEPNPQKCLMCHGDPPHPIWDTHPIWPGAYGERYRAPLEKAERDGLNNFLANQNTHPRYRYLKNIQVFSDPDTFAPSAQVLYSGAEKESPNVALSRLLSSLTGRALVQQLSQSPKFEQYKYALLASLATDCDSIANYLPRHMRSTFMADFDQFLSTSQQKNREQEQLKRSRMLAPNKGTAGFTEGDIETLTPLRYLAEKGLGIDTTQWTTALEKDTYDFTAPQSQAREMELQLLAVVATTDESIKEYFTHRHAGLGRKYCKYLREKSWANLK